VQAKRIMAETTVAIVRTAKRACLMAAPMTNIVGSPDLKVSERYDRLLGMLFGEAMAAALLMRTKPGQDPREQPVYKHMMETLSSAIQDHVSGANPMDYDDHHDKVMSVAENLTRGNLEIGLMEAMRLLKTQGKL
jgi:hypothetical protein